MPARPRRILLGVTGSIAAYKTPQLVRDFVRAGAEVRVAMTESAAAFVTPLTLATVSRNPIVVNPLPTDAGAPNAGTWHIDLAHWADVMLIAPASANTIAKLAHGRADSAVTMLALAVPCPLVVAPAMDEDMLVNPATQDNLATLQTRGISMINPASGSLASGLEGEGRLADLDNIVAAVLELLEKRESLAGVKIVVTAGPTQERIDPVRYIGNRSSGKMGFAIAEVAAQRGASVTLVAGPTALRTPSKVKRIDVCTAAEMLAATERAVRGAHVLVMAAAVADYTPATTASTKIKKSNKQLNIAVKPTVDILKTLSAKKGKRIHIGFALETNDGIENARAKIKAKKLDLIVHNAATGADAGIGGDENTITLIDKNGAARPFNRMSKRACAETIIDAAAAILGR